MNNLSLSRFLIVAGIAASLLFIVASCTTASDPTPQNKSSTSTSTAPSTPSTPSPSQRTTTQISTFFMAGQQHTLTKNGDWQVEEFTISQTTSFIFNFVSQYKAQAGLITADQVDNFKNNKSFSGYALFDSQNGYTPITLKAGKYYVAIRNGANGANVTSYELDYAVSLPASDQAQYYDVYLSNVKTFSAGEKLWHSFTVENNIRYFIDGCSTGVDVYFIPESELTNFKNNQTFKQYSSLRSGNAGDPGLIEISDKILPVGTYYLVAVNSTKDPQSLTYHMERWKLQ